MPDVFSLKNVKWSILLLATVGLSTAAGTAAEGAQNDSSSPVTGFGINTFKLLCQSAPDGNVFMSPLSIHSCLLLTCAGAAGTTAAEMNHMLGFEGKTSAQANDYEKRLLESIHSDSMAGFTLHNANSVWINHNLKLRTEFEKLAHDTFAAEVKAVDFSNSELTKQAINAWVNKSTEGKIAEVVGELSEDQHYLLVNAAYFRADWQNEFREADTITGDFHAPGEDKKIPLMQMTRSFPYLENKSLQAIELPYRGPEVSMFIVLPKGKTKLASLVAKMTPADWNSWIVQMELRLGDLKLPRVNVGYKTSCKSALTNAGMKEAFTEKADFSGMTSSSSAGISDVLHRTFLKVDEHGTEAAAATSVTDRSLGASMRRSKPFKMVVDHPFLIAVYDKRTSTLLFLGQITDPAETGGS